ncbi:hypothetical protein BO70DRAFT_300157, partial [Aspergillus heteromorphus CBS 117.55]
PTPLPVSSITNLLLSLSLPEPTHIEPMTVTAAFHTIYLIHFAPSAAPLIPHNPTRSPDGSITLVLRVSGRHLPEIKTLNEIGIMTWVRQNTSIPIAQVIHYSATTDNALGYEYTLLEKVRGVSVDRIYHTLTDDQKTNLVCQLTDYLIKLHSRPWGNYIGGLVVKDGGVVGPGPLIDETLWMEPDVATYWNNTTTNTNSQKETIYTLNPLHPSGYTSYSSYTAACLTSYMHAITTHPTLTPYTPLLPRLRALIHTLTVSLSLPIPSTPSILAHKDLHFGNITCDASSPSCDITGILDWEFSGIVPAGRWNPPRAFLWNTGHTEADKAERGRMERVFEGVCREKGAEWMLEGMTFTGVQEVLQRVVNHVRAIVEVCPRGEDGKRVEAWRAVVEEGLVVLGV